MFWSLLGYNPRLERALRRLFCFCISIATLLGLSLTAIQAATMPSVWTVNPAPTLKKLLDYPASQPLPPNTSGGYDCQPHTFVTRPARIVPPQTKIDRSACAIRSLFGLVDPAGYLELSNTGVAGSLTNFEGRQSIVTIPNSAGIISYSSGPVLGSYWSVYRSALASLSGSTTPNGEVAYRLNRAADFGVRDRSGRPLAILGGSSSFSGNGQWLVADSPYTATLRINLETGEVLPFGVTFNYNGFAPGVQTAISSDGRYAVVAANGYSDAKIYDLATCSSVPAVITGPASCQSFDLRTWLGTKLSGLTSISGVRFVANDIITFTAGYKENNVLQRSQFSLTAAGAKDSALEYLGLGDSFSSGEGAYEYRSDTDIGKNKCRISQRSYPYLVSDAVISNSFASVACSGAKIEDLDSKPNDYNGQIKDGLERRERDVNNLLTSFNPGYLVQKEFVNKYRPSNLTLSVVGNDIGFSSKLINCLGILNCYESYEDRLEAVYEINNQLPRLVTLYNELKATAAPGANIYVLGYPQLAKPDGNCGLNVRLSGSELAFFEQLVSYLNDVVEIATKQAGVNYIDVENSFNGHRLCEASGINLAVNGLTAGNDILGITKGPVGNESYHPTALGQRLLASTVLARTNNFTLKNPLLNSTLNLPAETGLAILNAPKTLRPVVNLKFKEDMGDDVMFKLVPWEGYVEGPDFALPANQTVTAELHSQPLSLGIFKTDQNGSLTFSVTIPSSVPTGFHSLHLLTKNVAGEPVDIYKTVYVAASVLDLDGDTIPNVADLCVFIAPAGIDYDQDGIDDGCDAIIGEPPIVIYTPPVPPVPELPLPPALVSVLAENDEPQTQSPAQTTAESTAPAAGTLLPGAVVAYRAPTDTNHSLQSYADPVTTAPSNTLAVTATVLPAPEAKQPTLATTSLGPIQPSNSLLALWIAGVFFGLLLLGFTWRLL